MKEFKRRFISTTIAIISVGALVFFSYLPLVQILVVLIAALLAGIGVWEYAQLAKAKGLYPASRLMFIVTVCEVLAFYTSLAYPAFSRLSLLIIVLGFISFFVFHFRRMKNAILHVAVELFGVCYLAIPFSFMLGILFPFLRQGNIQDGRWWIIYLIAVTKITDIGGYLIGSVFGKKKLAPKLSPKKTVEGAIGGFVCAVALSMTMAFLAKKFSIASFDLEFIDAAWMGMIIGVLALIGDLAESLLKRDALVKDSNSLPGLGGVLDTLDSLLFTSPVVYFFIRA